MYFVARSGPLTAVLRICWIDATNRRLSSEDPFYSNGRPTIHSVVVESVRVEEEHRHQGHAKRFLAAICADPRFEMVVVEGVGNEHLARFLEREGWNCDPGVMDFYWTRSKREKS